MSRWFRHYAGMCRDEKLVRAAIQSKQSVERVVWVFGAILESAAEINDDGKFDFDAAEASYFLRADESDILGIMAALEGLGRICKWHVVRWGERQFKSDSGAERQKRYRENRKRQSDGDDNHNGDGGVTLPSRNGDTPETETETETEDTHTAHERARDDDLLDCKKQVMRIYEAQRLTQFPDAGYCAVWKARGYDLKLCVAAVGAWMERNKRFVPLKYFDGIIADWHAKPPDAQLRSGSGPIPVRPRHGGKSTKQVISEMLAESENEQDSGNQGNRNNLVRLPIG